MTSSEQFQYLDRRNVYKINTFNTTQKGTCTWPFKEWNSNSIFVQFLSFFLLLLSICARGDISVRFYSILHTFQWQSKLVNQVDSSLPSFCVVFIYHWTCSRPQYIWNTTRVVLNINQAINHLTRDQKRINVLYHVTRMTLPLFLNK